MQHYAQKYLHAQPDFSSFWFTLGVMDNLLVELCFTPKGKDIIDLSIERQFMEGSDAFSIEEPEITALLNTVVVAIELYTEKYPERSVRCEPGDEVQSTVFRTILQNNYDFLATLFSIDKEEIREVLPSSALRPDIPILLLKRKSIPQPATIRVQPTVIVYSHLFRIPLQLLICSKTQPSDN